MTSNENSLYESGTLPDSVTSDLRTPEDVDEIFTCLASRQRRRLIECFSATAGPVVVEELVQHVSEQGDGSTPEPPSDERVTEVTIALLHTHLPKMDEAGVLEVDHETKTVQKGDRFDTAESLLEVV